MTLADGRVTMLSDNLSSGHEGMGFEDREGVAVRFAGPTGVAVDGNNASLLLIETAYNNSLRKIT